MGSFGITHDDDSEFDGSLALKQGRFQVTVTLHASWNTPISDFQSGLSVVLPQLSQRDRDVARETSPDNIGKLLAARTVQFIEASARKVWRHE